MQTIIKSTILLHLNYKFNLVKNLNGRKTTLSTLIITTITTQHTAATPPANCIYQRLAYIVKPVVKQLSKKRPARTRLSPKLLSRNQSPHGIPPPEPPTLRPVPCKATRFILKARTKNCYDC